VRGDFEPHFSLKHMFKDVQLGIHMANSFDLEVPVTTVTAGVMYGALNNGWADLDFSSVFRIYSDAQVEAKEPALPEGVAAQQIEDKKEPAQENIEDGGVLEVELVEATIIPPEVEKPRDEAAEAAKEKSELPADTERAEREPEPIPEIVMGDIFKRRTPERAEPVELKVEPRNDEPKTEEVKAEPLPAFRSDEVIKPESGSNADDIPQVIFGRVLPTTEEKKEDWKATQGKRDEAKDESEYLDLEKTVAAKDHEAKSEELTPKEEANAEATPPANSGEESKEHTNGSDTKSESNGNAGEAPRFRPLQRIRRFFSPAGK